MTIRSDVGNYVPKNEAVPSIRMRQQGTGCKHGVPVAIYRLLQKLAFGPEDISRMSAAYEEALLRLGLNDREDPLTEIVARRIVEIAQRGIKNPSDICSLALL